MKADGHRYVKAIKRTSGPTTLVVAVPVTTAKRGGRSGRTTYERGIGCWVTIGRRVGTRWIGSDEPESLMASNVWDWFESHCRERGRLYVVSPCASDFLTLMRFWDQCETKRFELYRQGKPPRRSATGSSTPCKRWCGRLVLRGTPDIVTSRATNGSLTFVSLSNFSHSAPSELAAALATTTTETPCREQAGGSVMSGPEGDCRVITQWFRRAISDWIAADRGTWRETISQMGVSLWRRKFYTHRVCRHSDEQASELESASLHGGRASAWYFGDVGTRLSLGADSDAPPPPIDYPTIFDTIHRYDVRAMYPALLRDQSYPVRLMGCELEVSPDRVGSLCKHWGVLARVRLETSVDEFPVQTERGVIYPVGKFDTTLAGPELEYAAAIGAIREVFALARYEMQPAFKAFATHLLDERMRLKAEGDEVGEEFIKRLSNSFGGKFAQRSNRWEPRPGWVPPIRWGRWLRKDHSTNLYTNCRVIAGLTQERVTGRPGAGLLAAVFAYLTSYGRTQMRELRQSLGQGVVLSQDTDGLWITGEGKERLNRIGTPVDGSPGRLRPEGDYTFARWYDAQHYYVDGRWTLAGYSDGFKVRGDGVVEHTIECNPIRSYPTRSPGRVSRTVKHTRLARISTSQRIGPDGWAKPPVWSFASHSPPPPES